MQTYRARPLDATKILTRRELAAVLNDLKRKAPRSKNTRMNLMLFRLGATPRVELLIVALTDSWFQIGPLPDFLWSELSFARIKFTALCGASRAIARPNT